MKNRVYRGITPETKAAVKELAASLRISASLLAELIFQAALEVAEKDALVLEIEALPTRMTLFPPGEPPGWSYDPNRKKARAELPQKQPDEWRMVASYRISESVHQQLKSMAQESAIGTGHLANAVLKWGLDAHRQGKLALIQ
jgi:hypothetical protein